VNSVIESSQFRHNSAMEEKPVDYGGNNRQKSKLYKRLPLTSSTEHTTAVYSRHIRFAVRTVALGRTYDMAAVWRERPKIMAECYGGNQRWRDWPATHYDSRRSRPRNIYIDFDVSVRSHITKTVSACFADLRQLPSVRRSVPKSVLHLLYSDAHVLC